MFLNTIGEVSYNGFTFDSSTHMTVSCEMVQDEAARTIIYQRQTFTIRATVADDPDTDTALEDIKERLGEQGATFIVNNVGFGDPLTVGPGGVADLKWGPTPKILSWEPIGSNRACEIEFQVVVCLPYCDNGTPRHTGVLAFNYEVDFRIGGNGDTVRTISGYLEIGQSRKGRRAPDCADLYRNLIKPAQPDGFGREQSYAVSKDKSRLDFSITDTQIPSKFAFPQGVTMASGRHRVAWTRNNRGMTRLRNSISMELEMMPGVSQARAWAIFGQIVSKRIKFAKDQKLPILLDELLAEEDIWGRASSFSIGYTILKTCGACLAKHSGIWQPIDTDWKRWRTSLSAVFHERGTAKLVQSAGDAIVDLCGAASSMTVDPDNESPGEPAQQYTTVFKNDYPKPESSYLDYNQSLVPSRERPVQRQSLLQMPEASSALMGSDLDGKDKFGFGPSGGTSDIIQEGGRSRYSVSLVGSARRAGYEIPRPSLESVGKQTATEEMFRMIQSVTGNWFGVPIYEAYWVGEYALGNSPGNVKLEANIKEDVDENGKAICKC